VFKKAMKHLPPAAARPADFEKRDQLEIANTACTAKSQVRDAPGSSFLNRPLPKCSGRRVVCKIAMIAAGTAASKG
jgi:hypothetical protein